MSRFSYVRYDEESVAIQARFKAGFENLAAATETELPSSAWRNEALLHLEYAYMAIGKAIRDKQLARGGTSEEQHERKNG